MSELHFLRPWFLLLLPVVVVALYYWLRSRNSKDGWQMNCDAHLLDAMQTRTAARGSHWRWLYWPIAVLTVVALAGPAFRQLPAPVSKNQTALVIALDLSKSMLADDIKPSRLQRARFKIKDILNARQDGQTALVAYAGEAFVVTPLTDDTATIGELLDALDPDIMPVTGSNAASAIEKAANLMQQAGLARGHILLMTDGVETASASSAAAAAQDQGYRISVLAVATEHGAPIPTRQGFLKDSSGRIVVPKLDSSGLNAVARAGGGHFNRLSNSSADIQPWIRQAVEEQETLEDERNSREFVDDGPWLIILILPLLALLYRRGLLMAALLVPFLPHPAEALEWQDLWLNSDQQAWQALEQEQAEKAATLAEDGTLKATAVYRQGAFEQAAALFDGDDLMAHYNRGNALALSGNLQAALESYDKALAIDPDDADTLFNKKAVEDALKQQESQQNDSQQQQQDGEQDQQQSQDQSQQNQQNQQQQDSAEQQNAQSEQMSEQEKTAEREQQKQQAMSDQQKAEEEAAEQQAGEMQDNESEQEGEQQVQLTPEEQALDAEEQQAMEQWLRRIKDDPGGLLRRKFLYQYYQQNQNRQESDNREDW